MGNVIVADMSNFVPFVYEADIFYQIKWITEPGFIDQIYDIYIKESVKAVCSLIYPELSLWQK